MKITWIILFVMIFTGTCFADITDADKAGDRDHIVFMNTGANNRESIDLSASSTAYTTSAKLTDSDHHGLWLRCSSETSAAPDFTVTAEYSIHKNDGFAAAPVPITFATVTSLGATPVKLNGLAHMPFVRFKFTSSGSSTDDLKIDAFFIRDIKK